MYFIYNIEKNKQIRKKQEITYPICLVYIDMINQWWPPSAIAADMGLPRNAK